MAPTTGELRSILESIGKDVELKLGLTEQQVASNSRRTRADIFALGTIDQDFSLPVTDGHGSIEESRYTAGVTISGYFEIVAPDNGTWTILVRVDGDAVINRSGVRKGDRIAFKAATSFWHSAALEIDATWSEKKDTTLVVHLNASY